MPLEACVYDRITASPEMTKRWGDTDFMPGYAWLAERLGYWPLFLSVGEDAEALRMTGYQNQWARVLSVSIRGNTYRKKGEYPSNVLFSFRDLPDLDYTDYSAWHLPLSDPGSTNREEEAEIMAPGRSSALWLQKARRKPGSVQAHCPSLDLTSADRIWCRSQEAKRHLVRLGFAEPIVEVKRLRVDPLP